MHFKTSPHNLLRQVSALCVLVLSLLAGLPLSAQSGDGRIEIPAGQIPCICASGGTGSISVIAEGSAGPFTFLWAGPGGCVSTEQNPADLPAPGWYTYAGRTRQIDRHAERDKQRCVNLGASGMRLVCVKANKVRLPTEFACE